MGKRNRDLQITAVETANKMLKNDSPTAKWIAKDVLRELEKPEVKHYDYPREKYRI